MRWPQRVVGLNGQKVVEISCGSLFCVCVTDDHQVRSSSFGSMFVRQERSIESLNIYSKLISTILTRDFFQNVSIDNML